MSTRFQGRTGEPDPAWRAASGRLADPAEQVALVAAAKREVLLRVHRHRLRREDLEDAYAQATLELVVLSRRGRAFQGSRHLANSLEQRFLARVTDRRRALSGRSPIEAAIEGAATLAPEGEPLELPDTREEPERLAIAREELADALRNLPMLSPDQRLVIATQFVFEIRCEAFCRHHGWSAEKYRKVAQRGRAKLRSLIESEPPGNRTVPLSARVSEQMPGTHL